MARTSLHVAAGLGLISLAVLAACGKKEPYPEEVKRATYSSCVAGFKSKAVPAADTDAQAASYCNCVVDGLQASVPLKEFEQLDSLLTARGPTPEREKLSKGVMDVVNACLKRQTPGN